MGNIFKVNFLSVVQYLSQLFWEQRITIENNWLTDSLDPLVVIDHHISP